MSIFLLLGIAVALGGFVLFKALTIQPAETLLTRNYGGPAVLPISIICGTCAGEEVKPVRTYLDNGGRCSTCGGSSYQLTADLALRKEISRRMKVEEYDQEKYNKWLDEQANKLPVDSKIN